jgi:hypothetical protein
LIHFKITIQFLPIHKTPVIEEKLPKPGPFDALQKLLRNNLIGVDIGQVQQSDNPIELGKWFHSYSIVVTTNFGGHQRNVPG